MGNDSSMPHRCARSTTFMPVLRRTIASALALALLSLAVPAPALAKKAGTDAIAGTTLASKRGLRPSAPNVEAAAGVLVTGDGRILWSRNPDARRPMASTTKMMTGLLAIEHGGLDRVVTVSRTAAKTPDSNTLKAGERLTVRQLLQLALVASCNDAAYALGESVAGDMPAFVKLMNQRARQLGLKNTQFVNPHGLDAPGHYSSAADLAVLARTAMALPEFREVVSLRKVGMPGGGVHAPTDELLGRYPGLDGVKTGYTDRAGYCFVGSAERDGVRLYAVVLGTDSTAARFAQCAGLLDWGFKNLSMQRLASRFETLGKVPIAADPARTVTVRIGDDLALPVLDAAGAIQRTVTLSRVATLPVFAGECLGEVTFSQNGRVFARVPAVSADAVGSVGETVGAVPVADYLDRTLVARAGDVSQVPTFDLSAPVRRHITLQPQVAAPVAEGQRIGEIVYTQGKRVVLQVPVVAASSAEVPGAFQRVEISLVRAWRGVFGGSPTAALQVSRD